jgi:transcriptional regulator with XRE-family HTH domain
MCEHCRMTNLAQYLRDTGTTQRAFAATLEMSPGFLSEILSGKKRPGIDTAFNIERATNGAVPVSSWVQQ